MRRERRLAAGAAVLIVAVAGAVAAAPRSSSVTVKDQTMSKLDAADRDKLPAGQFAFPDERKEPLENASHVRNAIARFDQVKGVSDAERDAAWKRIEAAGKKFGVEIKEKSWRELGKK